MKTLMLARKLNIHTAGCCSGHDFETYGPQINFIIAQGKENPNTRMMDALYMWMNSNLSQNISRCVWFNCEKQTIDNGERNPIIHPISVLKEMIDESHSLEEFDGKMGELFPIRTISSQDMNKTTDNIVNNGLKESSFKSFLTGVLQKLGLKSKDEHGDKEQ